MRRMTVVAGAVCGLALLPAAMGCPSQKPPVVAKEKPKLGAIENPENVIAEILVRDPEIAFERLSIGAGAPQPLASRVFRGVVKEQLPPALQPVGDEIDLHGNFGLVFLGEPKDVASLHYAAALKLKNGATTKKTLDAQASQGKLKSADNDNIGTTMYVEGGSTNSVSLAIFKDVLVMTDTGASMDVAGRWIAREVMDGTPAHDFNVHIPFSRFNKALATEVTKSWEDGAGTAGGLDPLARTIIEGVSSLGDADFSLDVDKENATFEAQIIPLGTFSEWASTFTGASPSSVLSMPKAGHAVVLRFPDSVSAVFKAPPPEKADKPAPAASGSASASASAAPAKASPPPASGSGDGKDALRVLGKALGKEIAFAWNSRDDKDKKDSAGSPQTGPLPFKNVLIRIELEDPAGARTAMRDIASSYVKTSDKKPSKGAFSKWGGDGETLSFVDPAGNYFMRWAVKGNYLYLEAAYDTKGSVLSDYALDPSGNSTMKSDARARALAEKLPKEGLAIAYLGEVEAPSKDKKAEPAAKKDEKKPDEKKADKKADEKKGDKKADDKKADDKKADDKKGAEEKKPEEKVISGFRWGWMTAQKGHIAAQWVWPDVGFKESVAAMFDPVIKEEQQKADDAKKKAAEEAAAKKKAEDDKAKKEAEDQEKANEELAKKEADKVKKEEAAKKKAEEKAKAEAEKAEKKKKKKKKKAEDE